MKTRVSIVCNTSPRYICSEVPTETHVNNLVKCPLLLSHFENSWNVATDCTETPDIRFLQFMSFYGRTKLL
jgi:hypothetical protein